MDTSYKAYREYLVEIVDAIKRENGLEEENATLILHKLNSVEKISRFVEWVKSRMDGEKLQATVMEICEVAVQVAEECSSPGEWSLNPRPITVNRDKLLKLLHDRGTSLEELSEIVRPMRDMTQEEKELYAGKLLQQFESE